MMAVDLDDLLGTGLDGGEGLGADLQSRLNIVAESVRDDVLGRDARAA